MNKKNYNTVTITVSVIAVVLAIFSSYWAIRNDGELKIMDYKFASLEYRPRLKISNPVLIKGELKSDTFKLERSVSDTSEFIDVGATLKFEMKLTATNIGNHSAKIIAWLMTDSTSHEQLIKEQLKNLKNYNTDLNKKMNFPFTNNELLIGDSTIISIIYSPSFVNDGHFILHILLYYENEIGQLFDTYFWLNVQTNEFIMPVDQLLKTGKITDQAIIAELARVIEFKELNNYSELYSKTEKEHIIETLMQYQ